jgi:hypothetical protein
MFNVVTLVKGDEQYVLVFAGNEVACISQLSRWAISDELSFTWYDAAVLSRKVREICRKNKGIGV